MVGNEPTTVASAAPAPSIAGRAPGLLRTAGLIAVVTLFSKLLGFLRDWAVMYAYGTSLATDAYFAAFQLPAFAIVLLGGLGGPFHTATVAVFSRLIQPGQPPGPQVRRLVSTLITLTGLLFTGLSILTYLLADPLMRLILHGGDPALMDMAAAQLRIMSPCILAGGVVGILYGLSNLYHCYFWPSLSPVAMSVALLVGLFLFPRDAGGMILAWATLAGGMLQVVMQLPEFFRQKFSLKPALDYHAPEIRRTGELLLPATIGTTVGQLVTYVDMFFATGLGAGGWSAVTLSNRLVQLPLGVLQTALLVPIFPRFSRAAAVKDFEEIKRTFKTGVVSLWLISFPLLVLMLLYTEPIIRLIFQHGRFDASATQLVSEALVFQAFQIIPYFARDSITRVFYAFQDARTPLVIGLIAIFVKALLNMLLVPYFKVGGITFAITLVTFINMILLGILSKKHIPDLGFRGMLLPFAKLALAALLMAGVLIALNMSSWSAMFYAFSPVAILPPVFREGLFLAVSALVGTLVYFLAAWALRLEEVEHLFRRLRSRHGSPG